MTTPLNIQLNSVQQFALSITMRQGMRRELLSPSVVFRVAGNHTLSGTFEGIYAVEAHLTRLFDLTNRTFDIVKWEDWLVGERHIAALVEIHAQAPSAFFDGRSVWVFSFDEGGIARIEILFRDESAIERFIDKL